MDTDFPYKWLVASPILPKKEDKYGITIGIRLGNDAGTAQEAELRTTDDKIGALAFLPDTRYYILAETERKRHSVGVDDR